MMETPANESHPSILPGKHCSAQQSPASGCQVRRPAKLSTLSEEKENDQHFHRRLPLPKCQHPMKPTKGFMSPTISTSLKAASARKEVLIERNESLDSSVLDKKPPTKCGEFHCLDFSPPTTPLSSKESESGGQDCVGHDSSAPPYDPMTNYLSPRPRFLRYNPNWRRERFLLRESELREELVQSLCLDADKPTEGELESPSNTSSSSSREKSDKHEFGCTPTSKSEVSDDQVVQEFDDDGDEDLEDGEEQEEETSWWRLSSVLESLLVLGLLIIAAFCMSSTFPSSGLTFRDGLGEGLLEIQDPIPHFSKSDFQKLSGKIHKFSSSFLSFWGTSMPASNFTESIQLMNDDFCDIIALPRRDTSSDFDFRIENLDIDLRSGIEPHGTLDEEESLGMRFDHGSVEWLDSEEENLNESLPSAGMELEKLPVMETDGNLLLEDEESGESEVVVSGEKEQPMNGSLEEGDVAKSSEISEEHDITAGGEEVTHGEGGSSEAEVMERVMFSEDSSQIESHHDVSEPWKQKDAISEEHEITEDGEEITHGESGSSEAEVMETVMFSEDYSQIESHHDVSEPWKQKDAISLGSVGSIVDGQPLSSMLPLSEIVLHGLDAKCTVYGIGLNTGTDVQWGEGAEYSSWAKLSEVDIFSFTSGFSVMFAAILVSVILIKSRKAPAEPSPSIDNQQQMFIESRTSETCHSSREEMAEKKENHADLQPWAANSGEIYKEFSSTRPPTVELLGEYEVGEVGSFENGHPMTSKSKLGGEEIKFSFSLEKQNLSRMSVASSASQDKPSPSQLSTRNSASYGSITVQKELVKKQEGFITPVRRSSRLRNRVLSP